MLPGSIDKRDDGVEFVVEWKCATVPVTHVGGSAALKDGIPVVLEGAFLAEGDTYDSDRIIVKHTEEYRTDRSKDAEQSYEERCTGS